MQISFSVFLLFLKFINVQFLIAQENIHEELLEKNHVFKHQFIEYGTIKFVGLSPEDFDPKYDSVFLFIDTNFRPQFYFQEIFTPVCDDNRCRPVLITLMWDLLGDYQNYRVYPSKPLTKIDHVPFTTEEYNKLHKVLKDDQSILASFTTESIAELYRNSKDDSSPLEIDGISGATPKYIQDQTIDGALYTCHAIWTLSRGSIERILYSHTQSELLAETLIHQMISSRNINYIRFSFENLHSFQASEFQDLILKVLLSKDQVLSSQIIRHLPKELMEAPEFRKNLWDSFCDLGYISQKHLLDRLILQTDLSEELMNEIISFSESSIETQLIQIVEIAFNQCNLSEANKSLLLKICARRKERLSGAISILLASAKYHKNNEDFRGKIMDTIRNKY